MGGGEVGEMGLEDSQLILELVDVLTVDDPAMISILLGAEAAAVKGGKTDSLLFAHF
jgi:hypothetical protein